MTRVETTSSSSKTSTDLRSAEAGEPTSRPPEISIPRAPGGSPRHRVTSQNPHRRQMFAGSEPRACAWEHGGRTSAANLAHLCRHHHRLKHESNWSVERDQGGHTTWTSPTGEIHTTDPPPF